MLDPDFRRLFEAGPCCNLVLRSDFTIVAVTDAYLQATMTERREIVGRPVFEIFPDDPDDPSPTGVAQVRASLSAALLEKRPQRMPVQRYPIRRPAAEGGGFTERFWLPTNTPLVNADGRVEYIIHHVEDVTEVVKAKRDKLAQDRSIAAMTARSERYAKLLDSAPDATVIVGGDGLIQIVNAQTERMFGYEREELIGRPLELLIPERFRKGHVGHMSRFFAAPAARPMGSSLELFGRRSDGSEIPIEVSLSPQRDGDQLYVSAAIRDISERKRFEAVARLAADRLSSAVDASKDAFALFDAEDRLILCNSVYRRLFHARDHGALVGKRFEDLLRAWVQEVDLPDEAAREQFLGERLSKRRQEQTSIFDVRLKDGRALRVSDRRTPEGGIVKTIWDVTDDERRAEELRQARAAAEAASAAKSEFLSSMSHELRTPLNAILGFAQLLQRDKKEPPSQRQRERAGQILQSGQHLLRLIDDVLDLARIEAGRITVFIEPADVKGILSEVQRTLEPIASSRGIQLDVQFKCAEGNPGTACVDRTRFAQILLNFGSNAIKYNRPSGRVTFVVSRDAHVVRVCVCDTGMGIPLDKQDKIFQPFQRAGQETGPIEGTGIGLVITKKLAELMKGQVGFRSTPGEGSEFWIDVPTYVHTDGAEQSAAIQRVALPRVMTEVADAASHLVLYIEDNPANVSFMRDLMSTVGEIELLTMPSAEMGIDVARGRRPEAIIMDINLPGMSGVEALRVLRTIDETRDIPVIALTAAASERDRRSGLQAGFYRYLTKPVNVDELVAALETLLSSSPSPQREDTFPS